MPSTQLNIRLGSDNSIFTHDVPTHVRRSTFNLSRKRDFTLEPGALVPVDLIETVPGDSFEISVNYLLKSLPLAVAPFTSYKVRTHWYYCRLIDLWKGAPTLITKGRSGDIALKIPKFDYTAKQSFTNGEYYLDPPESLSSYLGLPPSHFGIGSTWSSSRWASLLSLLDFSDYIYSFPNVHCPYGGVSLLPFFMYQKIFRMAYTIPNLLQKNKVWFPDDISDGWRIDYDKSNLYECFFVPNGSVPSERYCYNSSLLGDTCVNLSMIRYAMFEDDRFTTALLWPQRGEAPTLKLDTETTLSITEPSVKLDLSDAGVYLLQSTGSYANIRGEQSANTTTVTMNATARGVASSNYLSIRGNNGTTSYITIPSRTLESEVQGVTGQFSLNQFREMVAMSVWQERNARTQGDYNSTIYSHFGSSPRHDDYEPRYIGGTSDVITFGEVVQTSESSSTPQGTTTGLGQTNSSGNVGFFRCPDYGYIMGIMFIQPETVYSSGVEKLWTRETMEDFFMPEDEGLGLQEILNQEIFPQGTSDDTKLWGYQERNTEYKTRPNQAIGWFSAPSSLVDSGVSGDEADNYFSAFAQSRQFSSLPNLNYKFTTMNYNVMRRDFLAVPSMPAFRCSFATNVRAHRPMAYKSIPQTFGF